jgi:hypothetical protein
VGGDFLLSLIFLVVALGIAIRCRGARIGSIVLAILFPLLYSLIYVARNAFGDPTAVCEPPGQVYTTTTTTTAGGPPSPFFAAYPRY